MGMRACTLPSLAATVQSRNVSLSLIDVGSSASSSYTTPMFISGHSSSSNICLYSSSSRWRLYVSTARLMLSRRHCDSCSSIRSFVLIWLRCFSFDGISVSRAYADLRCRFSSCTSSIDPSRWDSDSIRLSAVLIASVLSSIE